MVIYAACRLFFIFANQDAKAFMLVIAKYFINIQTPWMLNNIKVCLFW